MFDSFRTAFLTTSILVFALSLRAAADEATHRYKKGEDVILWLNKVGPYHNPQEAYSFYTLPFCAPEERLEPRTKFAGIGEALEGTEFVNSDVHIDFAINRAVTPICSMQLDEASAEFFSYAISNHYWYQMYLDDLPIWGMVGEFDMPKDVLQHFEADHTQPHDIVDRTFIYTHKNFSVSYNGDRVIEVNLTSENPAEVKANGIYHFTYSVHWTKTDRIFEERFNRYLDSNFFEHQIHWFSLFNSFMMVIFLCGLVALILMRTLKADYAKYMRDEEELDGFERGIGDDSGWKQIRGDVFRPPWNLEFFSALVGTGVQLIILIFCVILVALAGSLYVDRGATATAFIVVYSLAALAAGYFSGGYYRSQFYPEAAPHWKRVMLLTALLFPLVCMCVLLTLNSVGMYFNTLNTLPLSTAFMMMGIWLFVTLPLTVVGTILGRRFAGSFKAPSRVNNVPRPIPPRPWYASPIVVCLCGGVLPFGSVFIEMYFIFMSFWNYKFYYVYGFMLLVATILCIVTSCVTIVVTYYFLNSEDHRWQWLSFFCGGSSALYVFVYSLYFFFFKTNMTGIVQTVYYFGYSLLFVFAFAIMNGTVGFLTAQAFVRRIYSAIKSD